MVNSVIPLKEYSRFIYRDNTYFIILMHICTTEIIACVYMEVNIKRSKIFGNIQ
jgi:hypothetical protein